MAGNYLLDTNTIIRFFNNEQAVVKEIRKALVLYTPIFVIGELYYGANKSLHIERNTEKVDAFKESIVVLEGKVSTAKFYGRLKAGLKKAGKPIPENDIWIAAIALEYSLPLVTSDKHFKNIATIEAIAW